MDGVDLSTFWQAPHRIWPKPSVDGEFVSDKLFSHHRIWPKPSVDGEFVKNKLFTHHPICSKLDVDGVTHPIRQQAGSRWRISIGQPAHSLNDPLLVFMRQLWNNVYYGYDYE